MGDAELLECKKEFVAQYVMTRAGACEQIFDGLGEAETGAEVWEYIHGLGIEG